jgi:hypothetical protein
MLPAAGPSPAERWVAAGRLAAAQDLILRLSSIEAAGPISVLAADPADCDRLIELGITVLEPMPGTFHFGRVLARIVAEKGFQQLAYFGAGSGPLMSVDLLRAAFDQMIRAEESVAVVNNYHSTDWIVLNHAQSLVNLAERLPQDNPLGWVLDHEAGYRVIALPPSAGTRTDIDTPTDLILLQHHPNLGMALTSFLEESPKDRFTKVEQLRRIMQEPASTLSLIGRASSHLWQTLVQRTQIWVRVFVEERGMIASGRLARGEVQSLVGEMIDEWGPQVFIARLAGMSDAVLWDTRVWMACKGAWPSTADRFAADLGWVDQVENEPLRELTRAINLASVPIITGGYGVVSGGVYALLDAIEAG